jgi:hypothetical protein
VPLRISKRPDPFQWSDIELIWPDGPLTVTSIRAAVRDGKLAVAEIAGKLLTTKTAIAEMSTCSLRGCGSRPAEVDDGMSVPKTGGPATKSVRGGGGGNWRADVSGFLAVLRHLVAVRSGFLEHAWSADPHACATLNCEARLD